MPDSIDRRSFLRTSAFATTGLWAASLLAQTSAAPPAPTAPAKKPAPKPPALGPDIVQSTVGQAHRSLEEVKKLVEATPLLVNACWDWGGGDFETPLEAAAHTGGREIALYLLSKGARPSLYAAGMLGQLDLVTAFFAADPNAHSIPGPHGFTLLHCVRSGRDQSKHVYDWLIAQGVPEVFQRPLPYIWPEGTAPAA